MKRSPMARTAPMSRGAPAAGKKPTTERKVRTRKCALATCRTPFPPRSMTHKCCSPECAQAWSVLERQRADRKVLMAFRETQKKKSVHVAAAQKAFNAFIRARDAGQMCISSGRPLPLDAAGGGSDAGHYRSVGSAPHLRFNEDNVHGQSKHDNRHLAGNAVDYRLGLIARIGQARVDALESDQAPRHYSVDDLKAIKTLYDGKAKALRKIAQELGVMDAA